MYNKYNNETLQNIRKKEKFQRISVSFYKYIPIEDPQSFRDLLYKKFFNLNIVGRIYISFEGINAQMQVPKLHWDTFQKLLEENIYLKNISLNISPKKNVRLAFLKLTIKCRKKIVADGLEKPLDLSNIGNYVKSKNLNQIIEEEDPLLVDVRNHYESEVGHFEKSLFADTETFREAIQKLPNILKPYKDKKIILYCTGGIRCEKASVHLKEAGFTDINQLEGGITGYLNYISNVGNVKSKFRGKNFVFDNRLEEHINDAIIAHCHQCGTKCDTHKNCQNMACHLLFIQCSSCSQLFNDCCSTECKGIINLSKEEQKNIRKGKKSNGPQHYKKTRDLVLK